MATNSHVSADDLRFAVDWLLALEGMTGSPVSAQEPDADDAEQARARRVAAWIQNEITRREVAQIAHTIAKRNGLPANDPRVVRAARRAVGARSEA